MLSMMLNLRLPYFVISSALSSKWKKNSPLYHNSLQKVMLYLVACLANSPLLISSFIFYLSSLCNKSFTFTAEKSFPMRQLFSLIFNKMNTILLRRRKGGGVGSKNNSPQLIKFSYQICQIHEMQAIKNEKYGLKSSFHIWTMRE